MHGGKGGEKHPHISSGAPPGEPCRACSACATVVSRVMHVRRHNHTDAVNRGEGLTKLRFKAICLFTKQICSQSLLCLRACSQLHIETRQPPSGRVSPTLADCAAMLPSAALSHLCHDVNTQTDEQAISRSFAALSRARSRRVRCYVDLLLSAPAAAFNRTRKGGPPAPSLQHIATAGRS